MNNIAILMYAFSLSSWLDYIPIANSRIDYTNKAYHHPLNYPALANTSKLLLEISTKSMGLKHETTYRTILYLLLIGLNSFHNLRALILKHHILNSCSISSDILLFVKNMLIVRQSNKEGGREETCEKYMEYAHSAGNMIQAMRKLMLTHNEKVASNKKMSSLLHYGDFLAVSLSTCPTLACILGSKIHTFFDRIFQNTIDKNRSMIELLPLIISTFAQIYYGACSNGLKVMAPNSRSFEGQFSLFAKCTATAGYAIVSRSNSTNIKLIIGALSIINGMLALFDSNNVRNHAIVIVNNLFETIRSSNGWGAIWRNFLFSSMDTGKYLHANFIKSGFYRSMGVSSAKMENKKSKRNINKLFSFVKGTTLLYS